MDERNTRRATARRPAQQDRSAGGEERIRHGNDGHLRALASWPAASGAEPRRCREPRDRKGNRARSDPGRGVQPQPAEPTARGCRGPDTAVRPSAQRPPKRPAGVGGEAARRGAAALRTATPKTVSPKRNSMSAKRTSKAKVDAQQTPKAERLFARLFGESEAKPGPPSFGVAVRRTAGPRGSKATAVARRARRQGTECRRGVQPRQHWVVALATGRRPPSVVLSEPRRA